jgi:hypothetical protein
MIFVTKYFFLQSFFRRSSSPTLWGRLGAGLFLLFFLANPTQGQTNEDALLERNIKESSNGYLYGEAVGETLEEALASARALLRPYIETDELKNAVINWRGVASSITDSALYLVRPRGNRTRAIVYLKQQDIPALIEKYSKLGPRTEETGPIVSIPSTGSTDREMEEMIEIIKAHPGDYIFAEATGATRGRAERTAQEQLGRPIMRIIAEYPAIDLDRELIENIAYDTECIALRQGNAFYALAYIKLSSFRCNLEKGITSGRSKCEDEQIAHTAPATASTPASTSAPVHTPALTAQPVIAHAAGNMAEAPANIPAPPSEKPVPSLLTDIMNIKTINELRDLFIVSKNRGKLVYGQLSTMNNPESSYLVAFSETGEILTFYGTGTTIRKNLLTGAPEQHREAYPEGRFMWFQLFE